jgi:hypothetical protein
MTLKQQLATAFLAAVIVGSVAWLPAGAESKQAAAPAVHQSGTLTTAKLNASENPQEQVRDLTYN